MNLFALYATLGLDAKGFEKGVDAASRQGKGLASDLKDNIGGAAGYVGKKTSAMTIAMGHALYDMGKAAVKGAAELGKAVISEYAQTEQLVGGVKKMFGDDYSLVIDNANKAFETAGLSANDYMETVTSFSATLLKGLGGDTKKAAEYADMAVRDMADNANTFGTDIASIQNAYQGFAKQNYTMLDNLKLGYGGTKSEMNRLLRDAMKIQRENGVRVKYSINSFDDIVEAIHVVQNELGITGTTEKEAFDTISGSFNAFKSSWKNWLSGLANDEADVGQLTDDLVESGKTALGNIEKVIPTIVDNVTVALSGLGKAATDAGATLLANLYTGLTGDVTSPEAIKTLIGGVFTDASAKISGLIDTGKTFFTNFLAGLNGDSKAEGNIVQKLGGLFKNFSTAKNSFILAGSTILGRFYTSLTGQEATAENIGKTLGDLFGDGLTGISDFLGKADTLFTDFLSGLNGDTVAKDSIGGILGTICADGISSVTALIDAGKGLFSGFLKAINGEPGKEAGIKIKLASLFSSFTAAKNSFISLGGTILGSFYEKLTGQEATAENVGKTLGGLFDAGVLGAADFLGVAEQFMRNLETAFKSDPQSEGEITTFFDGVWTAVGNGMGGVIAASGHFLSNLYEAITSDKEGAEKMRTLFEEKSEEAEEAPLATGAALYLTGFGLYKTLPALAKGLAKISPTLFGKTMPTLALEALIYEGAYNSTNPMVTYTNPETGEKTKGRGRVATDEDEEAAFGTGQSSAKAHGGASRRFFVSADIQQMIAELIEAGESHYGVSESRADEWLNIISSGKYPASGEAYRNMALEVENAYKAMKELQERDDYSAEEREALPITESATHLGRAAQALIDAAAVLASALAGARVELDGEKVGELVTGKVQEDVVRKMRTQFPTLAWGR